MKKALLIPVLFLSACSPSAQYKADRNAKDVKEDVKRGFDKVKDSPATKELETDVKRGFHKADAVVTKELEKGRDNVRQGAADLKRNQDQKNQPERE